MGYKNQTSISKSMRTNNKTQSSTTIIKEEAERSRASASLSSFSTDPSCLPIDILLISSTKITELVASFISPSQSSSSARTYKNLRFMCENILNKLLEVFVKALMETNKDDVKKINERNSTLKEKGSFEETEETPMLVELQRDIILAFFTHLYHAYQHELRNCESLKLIYKTTPMKHRVQSHLLLETIRLTQYFARDYLTYPYIEHGPFLDEYWNDIQKNLNQFRVVKIEDIMKAYSVEKRSGCLLLNRDMEWVLINLPTNKDFDKIRSFIPSGIIKPDENELEAIENKMYCDTGLSLKGRKFESVIHLKEFINGVLYQEAYYFIFTDIDVFMNKYVSIDKHNNLHKVRDSCQHGKEANIKIWIPMSDITPPWPEGISHFNINRIMRSFTGNNSTFKSATNKENYKSYSTHKYSDEEWKEFKNKQHR